MYLARKNNDKKLRKNILQLLIIISISLFYCSSFNLFFYQRNLLYHPNENNYSGEQLTVDD